MVAADELVIWNHVVRHFPDSYELSVDHLQKSLGAEKFKYERSQVVKVLQSYDARRLGTFRTGRRGRATRIIWRKKPKDLDPEVLIPASDPVVGHAYRNLEYPLVLRPGVTAKLQLPEDLSVAEAQRIADYVLSLPPT